MSKDFSILDFFEEEENQGSSSQGVVCKGRVTPGFYAMMSGHSKFFPAVDPSSRPQVKASAAAYLESVGGTPNRSNPTLAMEFVRYRDTFLNVAAPKWEDDKFVQVFHGRRLPQGTNEDGSVKFDVTPEWRIFTEPLRDETKDVGKFAEGEDAWFHYVSVPNPTFVAEDESTHTQYNHWVAADGKLMPNFIERIEAAFATKEDALEYMEEKGIPTHDETQSEVADAFTQLYEKVLAEVDMPSGFDGDEWDEDDYPMLLQPLVKNLMAGTDVKQLVSDHQDTPFDKKFIMKVKKLVE